MEVEMCTYIYFSLNSVGLLAQVHSLCGLQYCCELGCDAICCFPDCSSTLLNFHYSLKERRSKEYLFSNFISTNYSAPEQAK